MSSSRSDDVTKSVCVSVCSQFVKFGAFKAFEVSVLQGCLLDVLDVPKVSRGCLKGFSKVSQGCPLDVSRVSQGCLEGVSRLSSGCLKGVSREHSKHLK